MREDLAIRKARIEDAQAVAELHIRSWQWAYAGLLPDAYLADLGRSLERRVAFWRTYFRRVPREERFWLLVHGEELLGFAQTGLCRDTDLEPQTREVYMIYLAQEAAGQGAGRLLFAHAVEDLSQRGYQQAVLWVLDTNQRARRFYEHAGWQPDGGLKREERADGLVLSEIRYRRLLQSASARANA